MIAPLLLLVCPGPHHVAKVHDSLGSVPTEVSIEVLVGDAIVEAIDNVLTGDVSDGDACVKETMSVGSHELVMFLLALGEVMMSTCSGNRPLKIIDEDGLEGIP